MKIVWVREIIAPAIGALIIIAVSVITAVEVTPLLSNLRAPPVITLQEQLQSARLQPHQD